MKCFFFNIVIFQIRNEFDVKNAEIKLFFSGKTTFFQPSFRQKDPAC